MSTEAKRMQNTANDLDALAERYPQHATLIRTIKDQIKTVERSGSEGARSVLAAHIARLADAIAADRGR